MRHALCKACMKKQCQQHSDRHCHMRNANKSRSRRYCSHAQAALLCALFASSWCCSVASTSSECVRRSPHFVAPAQRSILCGNSTSTTPAECARYLACRDRDNHHFNQSTVAALDCLLPVSYFKCVCVLLQVCTRRIASVSAAAAGAV
jgi:hypothetical protein